MLSTHGRLQSCAFRQKEPLFRQLEEPEKRRKESLCPEDEK